jgi:phosphoglycolate phosphatase
MAGTIVKDDGVVERAFVLAAERSGITETEAECNDALDYVRATMGQSKIDVFRAIADTEEDAARANDAFEAAYAEIAAAEGVEAIDGAEDVLRELREAGVKIALGGRRAGTPVPRHAADGVASHLGEPRRRCRGGRRHGRDMLSGSAAGAGLVVGVLTGAHDARTLTDAGADDVLDSIADLPALLGLR